jgi:hypothetical protein
MGRLRLCGATWTDDSASVEGCLQLELLRDWRRCFDAMEERFKSSPTELRYMVVGSRYPGVFNLGATLKILPAGSKAATGRHCANMAIGA